MILLIKMCKYYQIFMKKIIKYSFLLLFLTQLTGCSLMWNDYWGEKHWWNKQSSLEFDKSIKVSYPLVYETE